MKVNGVPNVRTCIAPLRKGIHVETQGKFPDWPSAGIKNKSKEKQIYATLYDLIKERLDSSP